MSSTCDLALPVNVKFPVYIDGCLKYAAGLTRRTTIQDVLMAMVSISNSNLAQNEFKKYTMIEQWQANERIIPGDVKVVKLIKLWKSLPGDQWSHVKFVIKKIPVLSKTRHVRFADEVKSAKKNNESKKYVFCTLSPAMQKSWDLERFKRKSEFVKRELQMVQNGLKYDVNSIPSSSDSESDDQYEENKRYASIKKVNRSKNSILRQTYQTVDKSAKKSLNFSSSSTFTSVSSIDSSVYKFGSNNSYIQNKTSFEFSNENDSDTGVSSAGSDELESHLETLV